MTMTTAQPEWTRGARDLHGALFAEFQTALTHYNARRFQPRLPEDVSEDELARERTVAAAEIEFIEALRAEIAPLTDRIPEDPDGFLAWFEGLKRTGPGQGDPLFPWLASSASIAQMHWFLLQEVAGEAGFEDLLAMTQV